MVGDEFDMTPQLEAMYRASGMEMPTSMFLCTTVMATIISMVTPTMIMAITRMVTAMARAAGPS